MLLTDKRTDGLTNMGTYRAAIAAKKLILNIYDMEYVKKTKKYLTGKSFNPIRADV